MVCDSSEASWKACIWRKEGKEGVSTMYMCVRRQQKWLLNTLFGFLMSLRLDSHFPMAKAC